MSDRAAKIKEVSRLRKIEEIKRLTEEREATASEEAITNPSMGSAFKTLLLPLEAADKVTGAPIRAGIGALQEGGGLREAGEAAGTQFVEGLPSPAEGFDSGKVLESTPTMEDIAFRGITGAGVAPEYAETMAPAMGLAAGVALDPTMFIPGTPAMRAVKGVASGAEKVAGALGRGALATEKALTTGIARTGEVMTRGSLKAERALRMYKELNAIEMMRPGTQDWGLRAAQAAKLGEMRELLQTSKIEVPGSHDVALGIIGEIQRAQSRTISNPQSQAMIDFITEKAFIRESTFPLDPAFQAANPALVPQEHLIPKDLTIDELDDIVRNLDQLSFTPQGNPRVMKAIYGPAIKKSRAMADEILQTVPEGELFKADKSRFEALATAGTERGSLWQTRGQWGSVASAVAGGGGAYTGNGLAMVLGISSFVASRAILPGTYVKALAAVRMPRDAAQMIAKAHQSGSAMMVRDALRKAAEKYPKTTERLIRGTVLLAAKPEGNQTLSPEEVESIAMPRSFDPVDIVAEKMRIQKDESMPSTEKAKKLSEINKNGYVILPQPEMAAEPQTAPQKPQIGDMKTLIESLKTLNPEAH